MTCPFCKPGDHKNVAYSEPDLYPVAEGHTLVFPARHVVDLFDLPYEEYFAVWQVVRNVKVALSKISNGVTVGVNVGVAAGQTVEHAHVHVIPRRFGDVDDPRGGVRGVIPGKQSWEPAHSVRVEAASDAAHSDGEADD